MAGRPGSLLDEHDAFVSEAKREREMKTYVSKLVEIVTCHQKLKCTFRDPLKVNLMGKIKKPVF